MSVSGKSYFIIRRDRSNVLTDETLTIELNDKKIRQISSGEEATIVTAPGWYRINITKGILKSKPLVFKMSDGMIVNLECGCTMSFLSAPIDLLYECVAPGHCLFVRRTYMPTVSETLAVETV